ncbi:MAG: MucB/RseB C-terminal domain-containing protein, partial [Gammaproteobacteria bacterium]|nr:MucB/RseB C-terminal domain-containing protein [Gammaproteobacteria bacterium]
AAGAASASEGQSARVWLEKMSRAIETRNYEGTFFHVGGGRVETMRVVHRYHDGRVTERIESLDGAGREFVRDSSGRLICYMPDKRMVLVEKRPSGAAHVGGSFLGTLPRFGHGVDRFYRIRELADQRLLGHRVKVIAVDPKDQYRYGYRLWIDRRTAMPLKTQLRDAQGQVREQILFARLSMRQSIPPAELQANVPKTGVRWIVQRPTQAMSSGAASLRPASLPPGFRLTASGAQTIGAAGRPAEHLVYSDGLATVSLFVEPRPAAKGPGGAAARPPMQGLARLNAGFAFSTVVAGHQVTAVGEVPAETVEFIAHSVRSFGGEDAGAIPASLRSH